MKVLIIDDDQAILEAMKIVLGDSGHDVYTLTGSRGSETLIKEKVPHLIFLDIMLNGETGWDIMKKLKEKPDFRKIPIVILSAKNDAEELSLHKGADNFLAKPFEISELLEMVNKYEHGLLSEKNTFFKNN